MHQPRVSKLKTQLSLYVKLSIALFFTVSVVMLGTSGLIYRDTLQIYTSHAEQHLENLEQSLEVLLQRSNNELVRLASQYPVSSADRINADTLPPPSLLSGIESVYYLDLQGQILAKTELEGLVTPPYPQQLKASATEVAKQQRPVTYFDCRGKCVQRVFTPVIAEDGSELIINLNRSAALLLQDFKQVTDSELVLLHVDPDHPGQLNAKASTTSRKQQSELGLFSQLTTEIHNASLQAYSDPEAAKFREIGDRVYGFHSFPLQGEEFQAGLLATTITDVSYLKQQTASALSTWLRSSLIQISAILLILFLVLRPPIKQLKTLTQILRLLPNRNYHDAETQLREMGSSRYLRDEIDVLHDTMFEVNQSLQTLNTVVEKHRRALGRKIDDLSQANELTKALLDGSPLVIIIHDKQGRIHNINARGRQLTGLEESPAESANINDFLQYGGSNWHLGKELVPLLMGESAQMQSEIPLLTPDQKQQDYLWVHSLIHHQGQEMFLSAGMDISDKVKAQASITWLGQHDRVTGLLNRSTFMEKTRDYIHRHPQDQTIKLLLLDIDDFSAFNDNHGFTKGDELLAAIAEHVAGTLPMGSLVARTGSGEFLALLHHHDLAEEELAALCRFTLENRDSDLKIRLTGVIDDYHSDRGSVDDWISSLTSAMAWAKLKHRGGLHRVQDHEESGSRRKERYQIRDQLISALEDNRMTLFFQPIFSLEENRISHCEGLVRMLDDHGQFIPPGKFLGVAAEFNLLTQIDRTVLEMAMMQLKDWERQGLDIGLSINLTAPTLEQPDFKQFLLQKIEETGARPERMIFEVVETDALGNLAAARKLLQTLKDIGAKIAFDDFGVGFTSFEYVRELPVDYIKIDQSFVRFIQQREEDQKLVRSITEMGHSLGKKIIAEGVENREALDILHEIGVEYIQGYLLSRPLPPSALNLELQL